MHRTGDEVHLDDDEARGGSTPQIVRYVLIVSLLLALVAMSAVWITRAVVDQPSRAPVTAEQHALGG
ncbi:hypothetical protein AB3M93_11765 [Novosphingobium panipatense]|jgi:hypothetical protein|uniref:Uncharacterized protein n=1 Tax=Novosphingobium panipatense TaxID=428991 RepID=A0ABY1Q8C0_9SPHN|nr:MULTISPECIES: hypothetical protein [Novosphingobium]SMP61836.1 hypothetical protein SAMN06296065_103330 [Novosphingobium panipatense]